VGDHRPLHVIRDCAVVFGSSFCDSVADFGLRPELDDCCLLALLASHSATIVDAVYRDVLKIKQPRQELELLTLGLIQPKETPNGQTDQDHTRMRMC